MDIARRPNKKKPPAHNGLMVFIAKRASVRPPARFYHLKGMSFQMAKKIISKLPLLGKGQDIEDLPETDISMAQVFLLSSLIIAHALNGYPLARILNRFTVEDIATAYRRMWRWSIMMSVPGQEPTDEDSYKF